MERGRKMTENSYKTPCGCIHYFVNIIDKQRITLVFLPGLTADHRLFEKQTEYFENKQNVFVWDAPSHALSRPFTNNYSLSDMAEWLYEILAKEEIYNPIIIGQSMGGYLAQMYMELYPDKITGFISIDSAPLQKSYMTAMEIWLLERVEPLFGMALSRLLSGVLTIKYSDWQIIFSGQAVIFMAVILLLIQNSVMAATLGLFLIGLGNGPIFPNTTHLTPGLYSKEPERICGEAVCSFRFLCYRKLLCYANGREI